MMMRSGRNNGWQALWQGSFTSLAHWRVLLLWWLAGLLPALWLTRQVANAAHALFAYHPDAARIIATPDLAALADAVLAHDQVITQLTLRLLPPMLLSTALAPWAAGIAVTSLRAGKPPGFIALCRGGLREYARQLRLYLFFIPPLLLALGLSLLTLAVVDSQTAQVTVYHDILLWRHAAWAFSAVLLTATLGSLQAARAVLAADPAQHSALLATLQGWQLVLRRFPACLIIMLSTLAAGIALSFALQSPNLLAAHPLLALGSAQIAVLAVGWTRLTRLSALQGLLPKPCLQG